MTPEHKISVVLLFLFTFFCLSLSQAQTIPNTTNPDAANPASTSAISNILSQTTPPKQETPAVPPKPLLDNNGKPIVSSGKYEEYQSICRTNDYDIIRYYSADLKKKRADLLKEKIAVASEDSAKLKLRLLKEYIDQNESELTKSLVDSLKKEKLSTYENNLLNALISFSLKNYSSTSSTLNGLLNENKDNLEILRFLAEVYIKLENYYEASTIYEDLNKLTNNSYLIQLCEVMVLNSVNADAEKICAQAADKYTDNPLPLIYKGISHREREESKQALMAFQKSLRIKPTEMGYVCLAETYYMKDKFSEAAEQFKNASNISIKSVRAILGLAWTHLKLKNYTVSIEAFKKACRVNGKYESEIRKAAKILGADNISELKLFIQAAEACGG